MGDGAQVSEFDVEIAARTVYGEARGEDRNTQLGVAFAMVNRHRAGKWFSGQTLAECCSMHAVGNQYGQFSCWNVSDPNYVAMFRADDKSLVLEQCRSCVEQAVGASEDANIIKGATHYCNLNVCNPNWVDNATATVTIGKLTFFKNVN